MFQLIVRKRKKKEKKRETPKILFEDIFMCLLPYIFLMKASRQQLVNDSSFLLS